MCRAFFIVVLLAASVAGFPCSGGNTILSIGGSALGNNAGSAEPSASVESCASYSYGGTSPGVWFGFYGDGNTVTIKTCSGDTNFDTMLNVFSGADPDTCSTCVASNDDSTCAISGTQSTIVLETSNGVYYGILVFGYSDAAGDFRLSIDAGDTTSSPSPPPPLGGPAPPPPIFSDSVSTRSDPLFTWIGRTHSFLIGGELIIFDEGDFSQYLAGPGAVNFSVYVTSGDIPPTGPRYLSSVADTTNGLIYFAGGTTKTISSSYPIPLLGKPDSGDLSSDFFVFDLSTNSFSRLASLSGKSLMFSLALNGNFIYKFGGRRPGNVETTNGLHFEAYDISLDSWSAIDLSSTVSYPLLGVGLRCVTLKGQIYTAFGIPSIMNSTLQYSNRVWRFNPDSLADPWSPVPMPPVIRNNFAARRGGQMAIVGDYIMLFGGRNIYDISEDINVFSDVMYMNNPEETAATFDTNNGEWSLSRFSFGIYDCSLGIEADLHASSFLVDDEIIIVHANGYSSGPCAPRLDIYSFGCPDGYVVNATQFCVAAPAGYFVDPNANDLAIPCPDGSVAPESGMSTCITCAAGSFAEDREECVLCEPGTTSVEGATRCSDCPPGTSAPQEGSDSCSPCDAGYFAELWGSARCTAASPGHYVPNENGVAQIACSDGTYQLESGAVDCIPCPEGTYPDPADAPVQCIPCPAGEYFDSRTLECFPCVPGFYTPASGYSECLPCPANKYASGYASTVCSNCPPGSIPNKTGDMPATGCRDCLAGEQGPPFAVECQTCLPGTYSSLPGSARCTECSIESFQPDAGQTSCLACPSGALSINGGTACQCLTGTYGGVRETDFVCHECPPGGDCSRLLAFPDTAAGWQRIPGTIASFKKCFPKEACPGAQDALSFSDGLACTRKYTGLFCSECAAGYRKAYDECIECQTDTVQSYFFYAAIFILCGITVSLVIPMITNVRSSEMSRRFKRALPTLLISLEFLQFLGVFGRFRFQWDDESQAVLAFFDIFNLNSENFACYSWVKAWYAQLYLPLIVLLVIFVITLLFTACHGPNVLKYCARSMLAMLDYMYLQLCVRVVQGLHCDKNYLVAYPAVVCDTTEYAEIQSVAIICLIVYVIGIPCLHFLAFGVYFKAPDHFEGASISTKVMKALVAIVPPYYRDYYAAYVKYQVSFLFLRRLAIAVALHISIEPTWNLLCAVMALYLFGVIPVVYFHPLSTGIANKLALVTRATELVIIGSGFLFSFNLEENDVGVSEGFVNALVIGGVFFGVAVCFLVVLREFLRQLDATDAHDEMVQETAGWIFDQEDLAKTVNEHEAELIGEIFGLMNKYIEEGSDFSDDEEFCACFPSLRSKNHADGSSNDREKYKGQK